MRLRARRRLDFPIPASNRLRGALGFLLDEHLVRPRADAGPSGLHDPPRPFALRAASLDGATVEPGGVFSLELLVFWLDSAPLIDAFRRLEWAALEHCDERELSCELAPAAECTGVCVEFLTPTELKPASAPGAWPPFDVLLARICDRLSALRHFYGPGALEADYRGLRARARAVQAIGGCIERVEARRTSRRSGQSHPLGGFQGYVDYAGELGEFMPWLAAGCVSGVGRQTVWGKGCLRIVVN